MEDLSCRFYLHYSHPSIYYAKSPANKANKTIRRSRSLQNPPNFLRASALSEHISPVVVIPAESSSPESEHVVETEDLVDTDVPALPVTKARRVQLNVLQMGRLSCSRAAISSKKMGDECCVCGRLRRGSRCKVKEIKMETTCQQCRH